MGKDGANFSPRLRQKIDTKLLEIGEQTSTHAQKYEFAERDRFFQGDLEEQLAGWKRDIEASPAKLTEAQRIMADQITRAPIESRLKPTMLKRSLRELDKTARDALVLGATNAEDFKRAEDTLFAVAPMTPERAQKGDAGKLFKGPDGSTLPKTGEPGSDPGLRALGRPDAAPPVDKLEIKPIDDIAAPVNGPRQGAVEGVIIHHTAGSTLKGAVEHGNKTGTGATYYVDRDGSVYQWAPDDQKTTHIQEPKAKARNGKYENLGNDNTIGIEVVARNDKDVTPEQRATLNSLLGQITAKHKIDPQNVIGHGEIQGAHPFANREADEGTAAAQAFRSGGGGAQLPGSAEATPTGGTPKIEQAGGRSTLPGQPRMIWASEEEGTHTYAGPFQNSSLAERISTYKALEAKRKQMVGGIEKEIQSFEANAAKGILPPEGNVADLAERIERSGDSQVAHYFKSVMELAGLTDQLNRLRPQELEAAISGERAKMRDAGGALRATPVAGKRLAHMDQLLGNMRKEINSDPLSWAESAGVVPKIEGLDPNKPETLERRAELARAVGAYYNQEPQFFKKPERDALVDVMRVGGNNMLSVLGSITKSFGPDARHAIGEFAKDAPEAAWVGGMMIDADKSNGANVQAMKDAAQAIEMRRDKNYKKPIHESKDLHTAQLEAVGTAFQALPHSRAALLATADAIYETRATRKSITEFTPDMYKQAVKDALGEHESNGTRYGGIYYQSGWFGSHDPIVVPPDIKQKSFRQVIDTIRREDLYSQTGYGGEDELGPVTEKGKPLSMGALRNAKLLSVGQGQYWMAMGDPTSADPMWVKNAGGENYVLDLNRLEPVLRQRRPDLYLGADKKR